MTGTLLIRTAAAALLVLVFGLPTSAESLTLKQAIDHALQANPAIAAGRLTAQAAEEAVRGASALKNPEVIVAPSVVGSAGSDSAVLVAQPLEVNGSRKARKSIASHESAAAQAETQIISRNIVLQVKQLYWSAARGMQVVVLNQNNVAYLESLREAVSRQVDVGRSPGSELIKSDVELARARQELSQAELDLESTKSALNTLLNRPLNSEFVPADKLTFVDVDPDADALLAAGLTNRPELKAAAAEVGAAQGQIDSARAEFRPDVAVEARKESFDSGDSGVAVSFHLPVFDWGSSKSAIKQAKIRESGKQQQVESVKNAIKLEVEQAILTERTAAKIVEYYEAGILDKSAQLAAMAQKGYEKGATSYLEVLEAQRTLRTIKTEYISAVAEHSSAVAQLEWAANTDIDGTHSGEVRK